MDCRCISHAQIPHTSKLFLDFLYNYPSVSQFYPYPPFEKDSFTKAAKSLRYSAEQRREVVAVLREQNQRFGAGDQTFHNLEILAQSDCYAVVTGQQVGLFTGPAFAVYKALTAIKLAHSLAELGLKAVPLFWLATEDHDLAEVNHCYVQDRDGKPQRLDYAEPADIEDAPVGSVKLTEAIRPLVDSLRACLPDSPDASEIVEMVAGCYQPGAQLGNAFGCLIAKLFRESGVILVDPMDGRLHRLSAGVFQKAIESAPAISQQLQERSQKLVEAGYHAQVRVTENSSLLFLFVNGQRTPLRMQDGHFVSSLVSYTPAELLALLDKHPERFSPNVLLRPVMQDALLPTISYVGGPSELAYLAQAAPVYEHALGRMPVVFPRASFTVVDSVSERLLGKYGLSPVDVCAAKQPLRERMAARFLPPDLAALFEKSSNTLRENLEALQDSLAQLDPTLVEAAKNSGQKMQYQLSNLERKATSAVQHRSDQVERDAQRLENSIYPEKTLQERFYGGINLLGHFGRPLLQQLQEKVSVTSGDHHVVKP